jgi:hypothetical protein
VSPVNTTPPPQYPERRSLAHSDTGEWSLHDVVHELKQRRRTRLKEILAGVAGIITALCMGIAAIVTAFRSGDREDGHDSEITDMRKALDEHIDAGCTRKDLP